jgi:tetratricopeptide (TPR) repeat protein
LGRVLVAREALERALEVFDASEERDKIAARAAGQDAGVAILALMSWVLWVLGNVDTAIARMAAALEQADVLKHAHTQAYAWYYACVLYALNGDYEIGRSYAERCIAISEQHGFRQWLGLSRAVLSVCKTMLDPTASRLEEAQGALRDYQRAGYQLGITAQFVLLGSAYLIRNQPEQATQAIDDGLLIVTQNQERFLEAELYRLKGRALLARGATADEVHNLLQQALQTARNQQAGSIERRIATDLDAFPNKAMPAHAR